MKSFTSITALLLCSLSWNSVSGSESHTVKVQPGDEVTLLCSNISTSPTQTDWFRVVNRTKPSCISSMYGSNGEVTFCDGFQNGKFEMSSNVSTVFLKIKRVDLSDTGLYFCGFYINAHTVISTATYLNVQGYEWDYEGAFETKDEPERTKILMIVTLGALAVFFMTTAIVLAVKIRQLQKAADEQLHPEISKNLGSDDLNSAALMFLPKPIRNRRPASERQVETHVIYTASR
ncbi:T-cell surface glycoprotein CD8 beta chain-like [Pagrus major]|uniref:T-cell surface glycoprotein CD8 beta chain-like n=1 Tax=Pagrus major TaxID=143350 RepID=UPI003CC84E57